MKNYPLYQHTPVDSIKELLTFCEKQYGERTAFAFQEKKQDIRIDFRTFRQEVDILGSYLYDSGFARCHIAILGENSYWWLLTHFAVTCGEGVIVPIDKDLPVDEAAVLLTDSECKLLVYSNTYADIAQALEEKLPHLTYLDMTSLSSIVNSGKGQVLNSHYADANPSKDDLASIVYTSGTTGRSKGVLLTHGNLMSDLYAASCNAMISGTSILLLPLHHTFGLVAGVYSVMYYGYPLYINRSLKRVVADLQTAKPQNTFVVPLIVETLHKNIWLTAKKQGKDQLLRKLITVSNTLRKCGIDLRRVLFKSVLEAFGGNLQVIICGGAPLKPELVQAFDAFGITVLNGYGITECAPIVAVNRNKYNIAGSVGLPLCCNEVKISSSGEILVRGSNVMVGYYKNDAENAKVFTDGWFHTGDLGEFDSRGALYITGRIKNLIILSNGENIPAELIEEHLYQIPYVKEAVAFEENDQVAAELFLDPEIPDAAQRIREDLRKLNNRLPITHNISQIHLRDTEFPKTTTKKIKRTVRSD